MTANGEPDPPLVVHTESDLFPLGDAARDVITAAGHRYQGIPVSDEDLVAVAAQHADVLTVSGLAAEAT